MKGYFEQQTGERIASPTLTGKWDEAMSAVLADGSSRLLWKKADPAPDPTRCFSCCSPCSLCCQPLWWSSCVLHECYVSEAVAKTRELVLLITMARIKKKKAGMLKATDRSAGTT